MNKTIQNLKGFRDFLPDETKKRKWLENAMVKVCESWGYERLETPTLEPLELFKGNIGEDEKLFFSFKDFGGRQVALRYDQTVPTCRVIGQYYDRLTFPFRRYQIQSVYRAEKPQRGRFREFVQFDMDIFGVAAPLADAEVIALSLDIYKSLGFKRAIALVNSRDLMKGIPYEALTSLDKLKKIGKEGVIEDMVKKGISQENAQSYLARITSLKPDETIQQIFAYLSQSGFDSDWFLFEPTLARAFSYSQGPIWEIIIPEYPSGSVGGGERYDSMIERITGRKIFGTGVGLGFDRTLEAAEMCGLVPNFGEKKAVLVTVFSQDLLNESALFSSELRKKGVSVELYPETGAKLQKQLKYADKKNISCVVIIGPEEKEQKTVIVKNMHTKTQLKIKRKESVGYIMKIAGVT